MDELADHYAKAGAPKGEVVIVVGGAGAAPDPTDDQIKALLAEALKASSVRGAVAAVHRANRFVPAPGLRSGPYIDLKVMTEFDVHQARWQEAPGREFRQARGNHVLPGGCG